MTESRAALLHPAQDMNPFAQRVRAIDAACPAAVPAIRRPREALVFKRPRFYLITAPKRTVVMLAIRS